MVAHLVEEILLAVGFCTRLAALVRLPVLIGAVVVAHWQGGLLSANQSLEFSALGLLLLLLVFVVGSGRGSLDFYWSFRDDTALAVSSTEA